MRLPPDCRLARHRHFQIHGRVHGGRHLPIPSDELLLLEVRLQVHDLPDGERKEADHREDAEVEHALVAAREREVDRRNGTGE